MTSVVIFSVNPCQNCYGDKCQKNGSKHWAHNVASTVTLHSSLSVSSKLKSSLAKTIKFHTFNNFTLEPESFGWKRSCERGLEEREWESKQIYTYLFWHSLDSNAWQSKVFNIGYSKWHGGVIIIKCAATLIAVIVLLRRNCNGR